MTCIVGLATSEGEAFVGGDSCGTVDDYTCILADGKVFARGEYLIGCAGSRRAAEIVRHRGTLPDIPADADADQLDRLMAVEFSDALRKAFDESGALTRSDDKGECFDGTAIVAVRGRLYFVAGNFSVTPISDGKWATGSGATFAIGSLDSTEGDDPRGRVLTALQIAAERAEGVRPPFHVLPE
jgi:ATP-dependent protease HslVU (ClpYQ) peptidase subunit